MAKKPYEDYPENYFKVLENFATNQDNVELHMTFSEATSTRHSLHRFFKALSTAYVKDKYAAKLAGIARDIVITIDPSWAKDRTTSATLSLRMNPLAKMVMKSNPTREG